MISRFTRYAAASDSSSRHGNEIVKEGRNTRLLRESLARVQKKRQISVEKNELEVHVSRYTIKQAKNETFSWQECGCNVDEIMTELVLL